MEFEEKILPLCKFLEEEMKRTLKEQDHYATGKLLDSIKIAARKTASGSVIEGKGALYGLYVDSGRRKNIRRVPLQALVGWIRAKGIDLRGQKELSVAYLIQRSIYKNGIPTSGRDEKKGFITKTLVKNESRIYDDIHKAIVDFHTIEIHNIVWNTQKILDNA